eukprot:Em0017g468a
MNRCKLCVAPVLKSQDRKQLASLTSASCVAVLVDLACESGTAKTEAAVQARLKLVKARNVKLMLLYKERMLLRYVLSPKKERIGKSLGRNIKRAFAQYSLESEEMGKHLLARIHKMIRVEMKNVLKESIVTVTNSDRDVFTTRTWENHYTELQRIAPVLLGILDACIPKHSSRRQCTIAGVIAILVKSHGRSTLAHFWYFIQDMKQNRTKQAYNNLSCEHNFFKNWWKDSLAENLYATTPSSSPSLSEYSFVGNISPITPEVSCVSYDESDDIPSEPNEYPSQSTPVPAGIGNEGNEEWYGFRLVGDNVDKNVKPRDMRLNSQTTSLHYFHTYAVKDRIWFSHLSTDPIEIVQDSINFEMFYPTVGDNTQLVSNLETLVARMFVQRVPGLQSLSAEATPHIKHLYSKQMALKSEVVPLGVMLKNENVRGGDMEEAVQFLLSLSCHASKQVADKMFLGLSMQYTSSHKTHVVALDRGHWIHVTLEGVALDRGHWIHVTLEGVALDRGHWIHVTLEGVELDRGHWIHVTLEGVALDRGHWIHVTLEGVALDRGHWIHVTLEGVALDRGHRIHVTLGGVALGRGYWIHVTLGGVALDSDAFSPQRGHWIHVTLEGVALDSCSEGKQFEALASTTRNSPVVALQWIAEQLVQRVEEPAVESFLDSCRV